MQTSLLIVGWSVRAAAQSARRAGFEPYAVDAFIDADTQATTVGSRRFAKASELADLAASLAPCDWMFCGGLENHPDVVAAISDRHRLLGTAPAALRRVRDPFALAEVLARHDFRMPAMLRNDETAGDLKVEQWLEKRQASAGGVGVRRHRLNAPVPKSAYLQEHVAGDAWGATYLATVNDCRLLGVCEQLRDEDANRETFRYQGSVGPLPLTSDVDDRLQRLGAAVAAEFELRGLFGIDLIVTATGELRPLEVNPRYTASVELLERAAGQSLVELHVRACLGDGDMPKVNVDCTKLFGKRIVYYDGRRPLVVTQAATKQLLQWSLQHDDTEGSGVADIPMPGTRIKFDDPIATVFATAADRESVTSQLTRQSARLRDLVLAAT